MWFPWPAIVSSGTPWLDKLGCGLDYEFRHG